MSYVLVHNGGCEGHGPPVQVFENHDDAMRTLHLVKNASHGSDWRVYQVPKYPAKANFEPPMVNELA